MIILVDQDDVLAGFNSHFLKLWREKYPDLFYLPNSERKYYPIFKDYPKELKDKVVSIYKQEGFFRDLPEIEGAVEGIKSIKEMGHEVFICTSPTIKYEFCIREKYEWIDGHLGKEWIPRLIVTRDKTLVQGDYIIEDNHNIKGVAEPKWKQIIFDQPYNRHVDTDLRMDWSNYRELFERIAQK